MYVTGKNLEIRKELQEIRCTKGKKGNHELQSPEDGSIYPSKNVEGCRQKLGDVDGIYCMFNSPEHGHPWSWFYFTCGERE